LLPGVEGTAVSRHGWRQYGVSDPGPQRNLSASIDQLSQVDGLAWMDDLRDRPDVDWQAVTAAQETWDYSDQGLTEAGAALVALAVAAVSGGTGLGVPCSRCPYGYRSRWPSVAYSK
jgi:hypothetical protein